MGRYVEKTWAGNPSGATRSKRTPCRFRAYVPDALVGAALVLPAAVAADLVDVEQMVRRLNSDHPGLANLEPLARVWATSTPSTTRSSSPATRPARSALRTS